MLKTVIHIILTYICIYVYTICVRVCDRERDIETDRNKEYFKKYISGSMYTSLKSIETHVVLGNLLSFKQLAISLELYLGYMRNTYKV